MKTWKTKSWILGTTTGLALFASACGSEEAPQTVINNPNPVVNSVCAAGQTNVGGTCVTGSDFKSACQTAGQQAQMYPLSYSISGARPLEVGGKTLCQIDVKVAQPNSSFLQISAFPHLSPNDPLGNYAAETHTKVYAGDKLTWEGNGSWGIKEGSFSYYTWTSSGASTNDCNDSGFDGTKNGSPRVVDGNPAALFASDGVDVKMLGKSASYEIAHTGTLKIGLNAPMEANCIKGLIKRFTLTRCVDAAGDVQACQ